MLASPQGHDSQQDADGADRKAGDGAAVDETVCL
jgi:class 3 adenylate cyclase